MPKTEGGRLEFSPDISASRHREIVRHLKDAGFGLAARMALNSRLDSIGHVDAVSLDSERHAIHVTGRLLGAEESFDLLIQDYRLEVSEAGLCLTIGGATASPQWLDGALRKFVVGQHVVLIQTGSERRNKHIRQLTRWLS